MSGLINTFAVTDVGKESDKAVSVNHTFEEKDHHHHHHQSLNRAGRWGTTDDFATSFLHFSLFSTALWDSPNSRPVHSLMLSSHLFLCLPSSPFQKGNMTIPLQFASLYDRQEIFMWSNCLLDPGTDFLVGNMVLV